MSLIPVTIFGNNFTAAEVTFLTGFADLTHTQGDIWYANASGQVARLAAGTAGFVLSTGGAGANPSWISAGGTGTVTSVSVVSANGFAGTVATATTTPAITLTTSITGILKGNATAISAASDGTDYLSSSTGVLLTNVTTAATASKVIQRDSNANAFANDFVTNATSTATAGATTTLTVSSSPIQIFTGALNQTVVLPDATTLTVGKRYWINNNSSGTITVQDATPATVYTVPAGGFMHINLLSAGSAAGTWDTHPLAPATVTWGSGSTGLVFNTALTTSASIIAGASSSTVPVFIPQRGASTTGIGGDGSSIFTTIAGTAIFAVSSTALTITDAKNVIVGSTTGTKFGTATTQKIGFFNSTPIVQPTGDVITGLQNLGLMASATVAATTITSRTLWGQTYDGSANVTGSLTAVGNITGGASSMTITAGTGNSRTLALQSTTSGGVATTFLTGDASQNVTLAGNLTLGASTSTITGAAGNMTIVAGTGNSRTLILQTTTSGGTATTALTLNADQSATFAAGITASGASTIGTSNAFTCGTIELGHASDTTLARVSAGVVSIEGATIGTLSAAQTWTGQNKFNNIIDVTNNITASGNAATVPVTYRLSTVTNNSAATLTITMTTTSAVDGQMTVVRILDASAVAQTITWVNTENSTVTAPTTSNGSTTLPLTVGFQYNTNTSKWRCIASA